MMCHRSVGLIQNVLEGHGITTVSVTLRPEVTWGVGVPRAASLRFPLGNPMGEPEKPSQQHTILRHVLSVAAEATSPGEIVKLPYRWRRMGGDA